MSLRIAQIAPLWEQIPPPLYGGTERIVYSLTEGLVKKDIDVTLYACGTSITSAELISVYPRPLFRDNIPWTDIMYPLLNITQAIDDEAKYDILHFHLNKPSDYVMLPLSQRIAHKVVFTLHFPYPLTQNRTSSHLVLQKYKDLNYISISNSQREQGENLNWLETIHNGIDLTPYSFHAKPKDYFIWLGKFNPDKGVLAAIQVAKKAKVKLILAGKIDILEKEDYEYFKEKIEPLIDGKQISFVGEVNDKQKNELFGNAIAFLNPIQWNEPFGLVMTESMATGTPVISFAKGAANEIIENNITGFLVKNKNEMVQKIKEIHKIDRKKTREAVEKKFSKETMVSRYEKLYDKLMNQTK